MANVQLPTENITITTKKKHVTVTSPYWTRKQLADYLGCSPQTITRRVELGMIKEDEVCGCKRYHKRKNNIPREDW